MRPGGEWVARSYKSLERPAEYFGCHITVGIFSLCVMMGSWVPMAFVNFMTGLTIGLIGLFLSGLLVRVGRRLSREDPFWPDVLVRQIMDGDEYLDV